MLLALPRADARGGVRTQTLDTGASVVPSEIYGTDISAFPKGLTARDTSRSLVITSHTAALRQTPG